MIRDRAAATFDPTRTYRYDLVRTWGAGDRFVLWVMVNPSVADEVRSDRMLDRCVAFTQAHGEFDGLVVRNLFGFVSTRPGPLLAAADPVGPDNDAWLAAVDDEVVLTVCAWGNGPDAGPGSAALRRLLSTRAQRLLPQLPDPHVLGLTKGGQPAYAGRLPTDRRFVRLTT